ncbi:hypothetical protein PIB30_084686, partial [Stylosanthes scabra]|nr:hypothetical protein [Stylosanthes scabra]
MNFAELLNGFLLAREAIEREREESRERSVEGSAAPSQSSAAVGVAGRRPSSRRSALPVADLALRPS